VFDFELEDADMETLGGMTSEDNLTVFKDLYEKCCVRDCPLQESKEGIKTSITCD
jgi:hypothetical protein